MLGIVGVGVLVGPPRSIARDGAPAFALALKVPTRPLVGNAAIGLWVLGHVAKVARCHNTR
jgi:hypothetical protein